MADIVCIVGSKGGAGKTTLTHMLGHGLTLLGQNPVCVFTVPTSGVLFHADRRYTINSPDNEEQLVNAINEFRNTETGLGIVDGGASCKELDHSLYDLADLVLIPFRDSCEDTRALLRDMAQFPRAYALPCQWPTNVWQRRAADNLIEESMGHCRDQLLEPVFALSASKMLLQQHLAAVMPAGLHNACRDLASQIVRLLNIDTKTGASKAAYSVSVTNKRITA